MLADYIGPHEIMWATDYPHSDRFSPGAPLTIGESIDLPEHPAVAPLGETRIPGRLLLIQPVEPIAPPANR